MKSLAEAASTIADLRRQIELHNARLKMFETIFQTSGLPGLWYSPQQAADLLGVSRDRVMAEIRAAETARASKRRSLCQYGVHYRDVREISSATPRWQVQVQQFEKLLNTPPDER